MAQSILHRVYQSRPMALFRPLWRAGKRGYQRFVNRALGGTRFRCGPVSVRVPAEYSYLWRAREHYPEAAAVSRVVEWCRANSVGLFLDVGCEIGKYSLIALSIFRGGSVVACDSALTSLQVVRRSRWTTRRENRLMLVHGFITDAGQGRRLEQADHESSAALDRLDRDHRALDLNYVNLGHAGNETIPTNSLDDLMRDHALPSRVLIKMDIEGAEGMALVGSQEFLARARPSILLSLHPPLLDALGSSKESVLESILRHNYKSELLSVDHEEHWWFEPI